MVAAVREAGLDDALVQCAKEYQCDTCQNFRDKKVAKPASLPQTSFFNELLEMDVFHIKWNGEKIRVLAIIDIFSTYEMNAVVPSGTEKEELAISLTNGSMHLDVRRRSGLMHQEHTRLSSFSSTWTIGRSSSSWFQKKHTTGWAQWNASTQSDCNS